MRDGERDELSEDDLSREAQRRNGVHGRDSLYDRAAVAREDVQHVVYLARERDMRRVDRVDPAAVGRGIVHPHVVQVGEQHRKADDELMAVRRPVGEEDSFHGVREIDDAGSDVTCVDDSVVGEQRRMGVGRRQERVVVGGQRLQHRALLDAMPEPLLEHRPDLRWEMTVDRARRGIGHGRATYSTSNQRAGASAGAAGRIVAANEYRLRVGAFPIRSRAPISG